jgi:hypothetical protein
MKKIIGGMSYDTETAELLASADHGHEMSQAWWNRRITLADVRALSRRPERASEVLVKRARGPRSDLHDGAAGDLRRFLRAAGGDVSGREAFIPLASLHALSKHFVSAPESVERAISLVGDALPDSQGQAARALIARAAGSAPHNLSLPALQFVVRYFDLIEEADATAFAENIGKALWTSHPGMVVDLLSDDSRRRTLGGERPRRNKRQRSERARWCPGQLEYKTASGGYVLSALSSSLSREESNFA